MKLYALAASIAVGLAMLPEASAQVRGTVGVTVGDDDDVRLDGGLAVPTSGGLAFLLDGTWDEGDGVDAFSATGHLITRNAQRAFGGFIGVRHVDSGGVDADAWNIGGEYARFLSNYTLAGRVTYTALDDSDVDAWGLSGEYRLFAQDNLRFDFGAGLSLFDNAGGDDEAINLGAGVEHRFANTPISLGGWLGWVDTDAGDESSIGVTLLFDLGNRSLKDRDRRGNTFGAVSSMISEILP